MSSSSGDTELETLAADDDHAPGFANPRWADGHFVEPVEPWHFLTVLGVRPST